MVGRDRQRDVVVAEFQREFAVAEVLLVLPAVDVVIGRHAREPLGDFEQVVLVLFVEALVAHAAAQHAGLGDVELPFEREREARARLHRLRQVDAHHRLVDDVVQGTAGGVLDVGDLDAALEAAALEGEADRVELHAFRAAFLPGVARRNGRDVAVVRIAAEHVLVQLHPQVGEGVGRIVVIGDGAGAADGALVFVERRAQGVVGALLPVGVARRARGAARGGRRRQQLVELAELVVELVGGVGAGGQGEGQGDEAGEVLHVHHHSCLQNETNRWPRC